MRMISSAAGMLALCTSLSACQREAEPMANTENPEAVAPDVNGLEANTDATTIVNEGVDENTPATEQGSTDHGSTDHGSTDH